MCYRLGIIEGDVGVVRRVLGITAKIGDLNALDLEHGDREPLEPETGFVAPDGN
jgi:hypothetical protein